MCTIVGAYSDSCNMLFLNKNADTLSTGDSRVRMLVFNT